MKIFRTEFCKEFATASREATRRYSVVCKR